MGKVEDLYAEAKMEYEVILKELEPLRKIEAEMIAEIQAAEARLKPIRAEIKAIKIPRLADAKMLVARLAPKGVRLGASVETSPE